MISKYIFAFCFASRLGNSNFQSHFHTPPPLQPIFHSCSHHQPDVLSVVVLTWVRVHRNQCSRFHFCFFPKRYQESALFNLHDSWSLHSKLPSFTSLIYYNNSPILVRKRDFLVKTDTLAHGSILCGSSPRSFSNDACHQILLYTTHHTQERTHYTSAYVADGQQNAVIPNVLLSRYFLRFGLKIRFSRFQRARQTIRYGS